MAIQVSMPKLGLLMSEGTVVEWLAADHQFVELNQPIVHVITKKITYEVVSPSSGILYQAAQVNRENRNWCAPGFHYFPRRTSSTHHSKNNTANRK